MVGALFDPGRHVHPAPDGHGRAGGLRRFWALREFITLTPTRLSDHRALFIVFFVITPLQFVLVGLEQYQLYSVMIPVYAFLIIPGLIAMEGDYKRFLERTAKIRPGC